LTTKGRSFDKGLIVFIEQLISVNLFSLDRGGGGSGGGGRGVGEEGTAVMVGHLFWGSFVL
jgi:hypothetical protein